MEAPTRAEIDQQALNGLETAYAANETYNTVAHELTIAKQLRDQYIGDLGLPEAGLRWLAEASGHPDLLKRYDDRVEEAGAPFFERLPVIDEAIGRGSIGSLFFTVSVNNALEGDGHFYAASNGPEINEGIAFARQAHRAWLFGDDVAFEQAVDEVGKRIGRKSEAGMFLDIVRATQRERSNATFDEIAIATAMRSTEYDDEMALRESVLAALGADHTVRHTKKT